MKLEQPTNALSLFHYSLPVHQAQTPVVCQAVFLGYGLLFQQDHTLCIYLLAPLSAHFCANCRNYTLMSLAHISHFIGQLLFYIYARICPKIPFKNFAFWWHFFSYCPSGCSFVFTGNVQHKHFICDTRHEVIWHLISHKVLDGLLVNLSGNPLLQVPLNQTKILK